MMQLKEGIQNRKSIRGYLDKPVSQETIQEVLKLATRAVSAAAVGNYSRYRRAAGQNPENQYGGFKEARPL